MQQDHSGMIYYKVLLEDCQKDYVIAELIMLSKTDKDQAKSV
jgi:hypothetical protein